MTLRHRRTAMLLAALLGLYLGVQVAAMTVQAIPDGDLHPRHGRPRGGWVVQLIDWVMGPQARP